MLFKSSENKALKLIFGASGIYLCYFLSSILSEKIFTTAYRSIIDPTQFQKFPYPLCLCVLSGLFGWLMASLMNSYSEPHSACNPIPEPLVFKTALLAVLSAFSFNASLLYLDFPLVMMVKSCNLLAVIVVAVFFSGVEDAEARLGKHKLVIAAVIALGVAVFYLEGDVVGAAAAEGIKYGFMMLGVSLLADGFLPDYQAQIKTRYHPKPTEMYENISRWVFLLSTALLILTQQAGPLCSYLIQHPAIISDLLLESLMVASGHFFAYYLIAHFKQHVVPFVITTRKALSVLLSIVVYGHQVNAKQWVGIVLVFGGVLGELAWGWGKRLWWRYRQPLRYSII